MTQILSAFVVDIGAGAITLLLKMSALLLVASIVVTCMRRTSASHRHFVWYVALAGSLVLIALEAAVPAIVVRVANDSVLSAISSTAARENLQTDARQAVNTAVTAIGSSRVSINEPSGVSFSKDDARSVRGGAGTNELSSATNAVSTIGRAKDLKPENSICQSPERGGPAFDIAKSCSFVMPSLSTHFTLRTILVMLWLLGTMTVSLRFVLAHVRLARIVKSSCPVHSNDWNADLDRISAALEVRHVRLLTHAGIRTPFTAGWLRPVIVLPESAGQWSAERRRAVLTHELAHVSRGDYLAMCVSAFACVLYWFHPGVWMAARCMRNESERAADDCVVTSAMPAVQYATHLLALADRSEQTKTTSAALGMARFSQLEWRLRAMLDTTRSRIALSKNFARVTGVMSMMALVPLAALRTEVDAGVPVKFSATRNVLSHDTTTVSAGDVATVNRSASVLPNATTMRNSTRATDAGEALSPYKFSAVAAMRAAESRTVRNIPGPVMQAASADSVYEKTIDTSDSVVVAIDMDAGGPLNIHVWDQSSVKVRAELDTRLLGVNTDLHTDTLRVHTFSSDGYKGSAQIKLEIWMPRNSRGTVSRVNTNAGTNIRAREQSYQNPQSLDSASLLRLLDTTTNSVKRSQQSDTVFDQSLPAESGKTFTLNLPYGGDVVIHGWDEPRMRMSAVQTKRFGAGMRPTLVPVAPGLQLITYRDRNADEPLKWSLDSAMYNGKVTYSGKYRGNRYEFWVPRHTNIVLSSIGGSVAINGVDGDFSGKTVAGNIDVQNAHGSMNLRTTFGEINVLNSTLAGVTTTQCGGVNAANVNGALQLSTADGERTANADGHHESIVYVDGGVIVRMHACSYFARSF